MVRLSQMWIRESRTETRVAATTSKSKNNLDKKAHSTTKSSKDDKTMEILVNYSYIQGSIPHLYIHIPSA
ncbi:unnamed protein product [Hermetia illucens]|uniref:Uncharacterized protein n=1 Tax=Hermetia illucens TaxID=343691 RepID=A0A7R8YXJ0_HERIL|nr:unnamed protein product [Hermetia illucens]